MNVSLSLPYNDFIFHDCVAIIMSISLFAYILEHTVDKETTISLQKETAQERVKKKEHVEDGKK